MKINKTLHKQIAAILGASAFAIPAVDAAIVTYNFEAEFHRLDSFGDVRSVIKGTSQYQTHLTGTLNYDMDSGMGTGELNPFQFDHYSLSPVRDFTMKAIGDGVGGAGSLMLTNFVIDAYLAPGTSVSMVHDASGFLSGELSAGGINSATPASDGTDFYDIYTSTYFPLNTGPVPIATTAWNTTNTAGCVFENCIDVALSGDQPLVFDNAINTYDTSANTGGSIAGSPLQDGRYRTESVSLDFISMTAAPVPAAVWLFGSGLLAMIGVARRGEQ